jgi:hypothetical protein
MPRAIAPALRSTLSDLVVDTETGFDGVAMVERQANGKYRVSADGRLFQLDVPARSVPDYVVRMLLLAELDANRGQLHLHGGLVALGDAGVLVSGRSGAGKTTLVTALVRAGFDYVTDERVAVDVDRRLAVGFPKPVSLVPGSFPLFPELDPRETGVGQATEREWQVPASGIGPGAVRSEAPVRVLVIVEHQDGAALGVERLHPVSAAAELLTDSPDRGRFGPSSTAVAAELCGRAICARLTYDRLGDAERAVRELLDVEASVPEIEVLRAAGPGPSGVGTGVLGLFDVPVRAHDRPLVVVDGRTLAYGPRGDDLVELDDVTTGWLMLVDGRSTVAELVDVVGGETGTPRALLEAGALQVLNGLATHGFVASARSAAKVTRSGHFRD